MLGSRGESVILRMRRSCGTQSKAFVKSTAKAIVRSGGLRWLKPVATVWESGRRAVVVDRNGLNPCCVEERGKASVRWECKSRSSTFAAGESSEMGLYEVPKDTGLPALGMATMVALFQIDGRSQEERDRLKRAQR